jgi:hypothetical protein
VQEDPSSQSVTAPTNQNIPTGSHSPSDLVRTLLLTRIRCVPSQSLRSPTRGAAGRQGPIDGGSSQVNRELESETHKPASPSPIPVLKPTTADYHLTIIIKRAVQTPADVASAPLGPSPGLPW